MISNVIKTVAALSALIGATSAYSEVVVIVNPQNSVVRTNLELVESVLR